MTEKKRTNLTRPELRKLSNFISQEAKSIGLPGEKTARDKKLRQITAIGISKLKAGKLK